MRHFLGDAWERESTGLKRVAGLFCRNECASLLMPAARFRLLHRAGAGGRAILLTSIRLHCLPERFHLRYRGPAVFHLGVEVRGEEELVAVAGVMHPAAVILLPARRN